MSGLLRMGVQEIAIETSGASPVEWVHQLKMRSHISLVMDYKLPSSEMSRNMIQSNYQFLRKGDVLKFVCSDLEDAHHSLQILNRIRNTHSIVPVIYYHAIGGVVSKDIAAFVMNNTAHLQKRFDIRFGTQLHKMLWGNKRGT